MDFDYSDENIVIETTSDEVFRQALKARDLYPRNDTSGCAVCQSGVTLKCDSSCYSTPGYECVQVVSVSDCRECPGTKCRKSSTATTSGSASSSSTAGGGGGGGGGGPNAGIIAGATIGGIVLISLVAFLVWFFFIKKKRAQERASTYSSVGNEKTLGGRRALDPADDTASRNNRSSMHTVHSIASTVLTRASNIIQIAYIPGVTNRANPTSPTVLVPPVPPIPIQVTDAGSTTPRTFEDEHFFMPGDLRASTYSDMSGFSDRTSYARQSYAMRNSVASTIYGKNAVIASAAQTGQRVKPAMVSVRSGPVPPMPTLDTDKYTPRPKSRAESTFSVGSTYVNSASAATAIPMKGQAIRVVAGKKSASSMNSSGGDGKTAGPVVVTLGGAKPSADPFSDPDERPVNAARMSAVMEEEPAAAAAAPAAAKMAAVAETETETETEAETEDRETQRSRTKRDSSPFSDAHATRD